MDGKCVEKSTHPMVVAEENKRKLSINNPSKKVIRKIRVDDCLITEGIRCDYMFEIDEPIKFVIYLELKGGHIERAYKQLTATLTKFKAEHKYYKKECHVVASSAPKSTPKSQQLKIRFRKDNAAELIISSRKKEIFI